MGINLKKGQGINLSKSDYDLSEVTLGLGWDIAKPKGLFGGIFSKAEEYDLDAVAFLCGADGRVQHRGDSKLVGGDVIFFNNLKHPRCCCYIRNINRRSC